MNAIICFAIRGFDDLLIPLRDANDLDLPATTFGHSIMVILQFLWSFCTWLNITVNYSFLLND